ISDFPYPNYLNKIELPSMKCQFIILLSLLLAGNCIRAQSFSLRDSLHIEQLLEKANTEGISGSLQKGRLYADSALQLSKQTGYAKGEGFAYLKIADLYKLRNEYEEVAPWLQKGLQVARQTRDTFMLALGIYQEGQYYLFNDKPSEA